MTFTLNSLPPNYSLHRRTNSVTGRTTYVVGKTYTFLGLQIITLMITRGRRYEWMTIEAAREAAWLHYGRKKHTTTRIEG